MLVRLTVLLEMKDLLLVRKAGVERCGKVSFDVKEITLGLETLERRRSEMARAEHVWLDIKN